METVETVVKSLKSCFLETILRQKRENPSISPKKKNEFRLTTYNIHYFTDIYESTSTYSGILKDMKNIDSDVIGLEESILGNKVSINKTVTIDTTHFFKDVDKLGYNKTIFCNSVPSWYEAIYGNVVLVKKKYCKDTLCETLNEEIYTFDKSTKTTIVSGKHSGTPETRCFIKIHLKYGSFHLHIYTTHLDVATENERLRQIKYIINDSKIYNKKNDVVFIMGDFNSTGNDSLVMNELLKKHFIDCHTAEQMTVWNGTRVDYIFCNKRIHGNYRAEYYYTTNSDHIPVIITLTPDCTFHSSKKGSQTRRKK
jgi:endonuclease/exonuclease/phosphatase family metal-dependent hydrolase